MCRNFQGRLTKLRNSRIAAALTEADTDSLAHSARVADHLTRCIERGGGSIAFSEFMHEALYAPGLGYYAAGTSKFGADGDFVTAPEISPVFARILARQSIGILGALDEKNVLELGAGTGRLSAVLLKSLAAAGMAPERHLILEVSPDLAERQLLHIRAEAPDLAERVEWVDRLPEHFTGVVIANEVADALPVERFRKRAGEIMQLRVVLQAGEFAWAEAPAPAFLAKAVRDIETSIGRVLPDGYTSEVAAALPAWIADVGACIERGFFFLVDYGLPRNEYYAADRGEGWLRCHFRHQAHSDPLILPGIQDLTAWVDFTAVAEAASAAGLTVAGFLPQAQFLLQGGLEEEFAEFERLPTAAQIELSAQVKILTLPGEMGEHCKCIGLARGSLPTPPSFLAGDRAFSL